jgi:hypothetical protein
MDIGGRKMRKPKIIMSHPRMDDKELYERTLAVIDSQYKIYLRKGNIFKNQEVK